MTVEQIDAVGQGRIWSGVAALNNGLVDTNEGFAGALAQIREASDARRGVPVRLVHMSLPRLSGIRLAATALGMQAPATTDAATEWLGAFSDVLGLTSLLQLLELRIDGGDTIGLAHMEWLFSQPL